MTSRPKRTAKRSASKKSVREFLASKFPQRAEPKLDILIALPLRLIELVQQRAPGLWTAEDVRFETTLREQVGSGICRNVSFLTDYAGYPNEAASERRTYTVSRRSDNLRHSISEQQLQSLREQGWSEVRIELLQRQADTLAERIHELTKGYLGWLVTEPLLTTVENGGAG